jgi:hypothetical protein
LSQLSRAHAILPPQHGLTVQDPTRMFWQRETRRYGPGPTI